MIIQIAGITNIEDAVFCAKNGIDIIGLLVGQKHTSSEFISKELARDIKLALPKQTKTTLITHLEDADEIIKLAQFIGVDYIQLHSYIDEQQVAKIHTTLPQIKLIRLIHINNGKVINNISKFKYVDFYFTDSINTQTNQFGGTGLTHDFNIDKELIKTLDKPVFVAGGLTPDNVQQVIALCKPYGVDVNSGCRGKNYYRDRQKVLQFVKNAKRKSL